MSWKLVINGMVNGPVVSVQDLEVLETCISLMLFTILAAESLKPTGKFINNHVWGGYENEKTQTMPQSWFTESLRPLLMILLQKWQSDMIMMMMVMVMVVVMMAVAVVMMMIVNCMGQHIHEV